MQKKLMAVFSSICVLALVLVALLSWYELRAIEQGKKSLLQASAEGWVDKLDRNLFERYGDVQAFAMSEPARSLSRSRIQDFMTDMMGAYAPIYDLMIVTDHRGRVVAANSVDKNGKPLDVKGFLGKDLSGEAWFKEAAADKIKPGTSYVEDLHIDQDVASLLPATKGRVMNFTAPIRDKSSGKVIGVWSNRVSWADVIEAITNEEMSKVKTGNITFVAPMLVDATGTFLLHPAQDQVLTGKFAGFSATATGTQIQRADVSFEGFSGVGLEAVVKSKGYSTYPGRGWVGIVDIPRTDATTTLSFFLVGFTVVALIIFGFIASRFVAALSGSIANLNRDIAVNVDKVTALSKELRTSSHNLAESNSEQAAAIEETVASMEEMTSMIAQTAQNASASVELLETSRSHMERGNQVVQRLAQAMTDIEGTNNQLNAIVKMIGEIESKTRVINDIVFETRLLSFNASIEAARAGAHGRGFAVVAEEVGKLAAMSGKAADEIRQLLESSTREVGHAVSVTKDKVAVGKQVSTECTEVFHAVSSSMDQMMASVRSIASASKEQQTGVQQTNTAMQEMDKVTQRNTQSSDGLSTLANNLGAGAEQLTDSVLSMRRLLDGPSAQGGLGAELATGSGDGTPTISQSIGRAVGKGSVRAGTPDRSRSVATGQRSTSGSGESSATQSQAGTGGTDEISVVSASSAPQTNTSAGSRAGSKKVGRDDKRWKRAS